MLETLYKDFLSAHKKWNDEQIARDKIRFSKEYTDKLSMAALLTDEAAEMLEGLPDSSEALCKVKKDLQKELVKADLSHYENVKLKYKKSKSVDKNELLKVLDGDLDLYVSLSNVTQVSLTAHAKGSVHEKELMDCVKETSVPVDIELAESPNS